MLKSKSPEQIADPVAISPQTSQDYAKRAWLFYGRQDLPHAEQDFRRALDLDSQDVDSLSGLGLTLAAAGKLPEAVQVFEQAVQLAAGLKDAVRGLMLKRLLNGHINRIRTGQWNLDKA